MTDYNIHDIFIIYYRLSVEIGQDLTFLENNLNNKKQYQLISEIESIKIKILNWIIKLLEIYPQLDNIDIQKVNLESFEPESFTPDDSLNFNFSDTLYFFNKIRGSLLNVRQHLIREQLENFVYDTNIIIEQVNLLIYASRNFI